MCSWEGSEVVLVVAANVAGDTVDVAEAVDAPTETAGAAALEEVLPCLCRAASSHRGEMGLPASASPTTRLDDASEELAILASWALASLACWRSRFLGGLCIVSSKVGRAVGRGAERVASPLVHGAAARLSDALRFWLVVGVCSVTSGGELLLLLKLLYACELCMAGVARRGDSGGVSPSPSNSATHACESDSSAVGRELGSWSSRS